MIRVKEENERADLKINIKLRSWIWPLYFMANRGDKGGSSDRLFFLGSKVIAGGDCSHEIRR